MTQIFREQFDTPARPRRRLTEELAHREEQRRAARGIAPATVTEPTLHERGNPVPLIPSWTAPDWIYPAVNICNCDRVEGDHAAWRCNGVRALIPSFLVIDANATLTIINIETGEQQSYPIHVAPINRWVNSWGGEGEASEEAVGGPAPSPWRSTLEIPHGSYTPFDGSFDYFGNDPAQWEHGTDGGTPMTLEELLGADEKMDEIDRILDE